MDNQPFWSLGPKVVVMGEERAEGRKIVMAMGMDGEAQRGGGCQR